MHRTAIAACVALAAAALVTGCGHVDEAPPAPPAPPVVWHGFDEGLALAAKEKKPVVVDFYTSWCVWCKRMDQRTFSDPGIRSYLAEHFVAVRLDAEARGARHTFEGRTYSAVELTRRFGVRGFPSLGYLGRDGTIVTVVPGFQTPGQLKPMLEYVEKECYRNQMSFEEFLERRGDCD